MQEPDEVDEENFTSRDRLRHPELAQVPIETAKGALAPALERNQDLLDKPQTFNAIPVNRSLMGSGWIKEIISAHPHEGRRIADDTSHESALARAAVSGHTGDNRTRQSRPATL
jgi:hypothetical protein